LRGVTGSESSCDVPLGPAVEACPTSSSSACDVTLKSPKALRRALGLMALRVDAGDPYRVEADMVGLCARWASAVSIDLPVKPPLHCFSQVRHRLIGQPVTISRFV
jgi:hypothetical protein